MRPLSPEESDLWARVTASIRPLSRDVKSSPERGGGPPKMVEGSRPAHRPLRQRSALPPPRSGEDLKSRSLDSTWDRKLRTGAVEPDRIVDLHGMTLDTAWRAIDRALEQAVNHGERLVLLITGHHRPGAPPVERGKIRAAVHDWLAASRHAGRIAAVRGAS